MANNYTSPFTSAFPDMPEISGVAKYTFHTGMKYDREDLLFITLPKKTSVAAVFTKNTIPGAPIIWSKEILPRGTARALLVNSGIANVYTGKIGLESVRKTAAKAAQIIGCDMQDIYISSTGVIGERINDEKVIEALSGEMHKASWEQATKAIGTTDTFPKGAFRTATIGNEKVNLCGIIKGSGMIAPDMATMLGYVFTDAKIPSNILQQWLVEATKQTYNCITVDSDTSTSDTILAFATGQKEHWECSSADDPAWQDFREQFISLNKELAHLVVKDGEGANKFVTVNIKNAESDESAHKIALSVANSPLVKCAIAGEDPNWGRIIMAVGKSAEKVDPFGIQIWMGPHQITKDGTVCEDYKEVDAALYMKEAEIEITVDIGVRNGKATVWTTDLTHEYININVDYRS